MDLFKAKPTLAGMEVIILLKHLLIFFAPGKTHSDKKAVAYPRTYIPTPTTHTPTHPTTLTHTNTQTLKHTHTQTQTHLLSLALTQTNSPTPESLAHIYAVTSCCLIVLTALRERQRTVFLIWKKNLLNSCSSTSASASASA